jgi:hypothetical protein
MSKEQFDLKQVAIEALTDKETGVPTMPVAIALQEAEDLYQWCLNDKEMLAKAGLDLALIDDLPNRIGACRYMQSMWQKDFKSVEDSQREWLAKSPAAYELRDDILHHFFHAYRKNPDLLSKVQKISEGNSHADMIQDLSDMAVLGTSNPEPLKGISFDMNMLTTAAATSTAMANLLAQSNGARMSDNKLKTLRDKAYTYMKQAVDEIRHNGQYIFWHNEERKKGYVSRYMQSKANQQKKATQTVTESN